MFDDNQRASAVAEGVGYLINNDDVNDNSNDNNDQSGGNVSN